MLWLCDGFDLSVCLGALVACVVLLCCVVLCYVVLVCVVGRCVVGVLGLVLCGWFDLCCGLMFG